MLPDITHKQFLALGFLARESLSGPELRLLLAPSIKLVGKSGRDKFYPFMGRLVRDGLATGDSQYRGETIYRITTLGRAALKQTKEFYEQYSLLA